MSESIIESTVPTIIIIESGAAKIDIIEKESEKVIITSGQPSTINIDTSTLAKETKQDTSNTLLSSIDTKLSSPVQVSTSSLPLPSGASTSGLQTSGNNSLSSIDSKLTDVANNTTLSLIELGLGAKSDFLASTDTGNFSLISLFKRLLDKLTNIITVSVNNFPITQSISGSVSVSNFPSNTGLTDSELRASPVQVSTSSLPLPSGASTSAKQDIEIASLSSIDSKLTDNATATLQANTNSLLASIELNTSNIPTNGQKPSLNCLPVVLSNEQSVDDSITGQAGQSVLNNNVFLASAGVLSIDTFSNGVSYRSFYCQIVASAGISAGQIIFEGSNNNINFHSLTVWDDAALTGSPINTSIGISANTNRFFSGRVGYRYIRCRISIAFVGGTIQAFTTFSLSNYEKRITPVSQTTGATFSTTLSSSLPSGTAVIGQVGLTTGISSTDIAGGVITTSTTTSAISPSNALSAEFTVNVTAVSGTNPTLDIRIELSKNGGTNWIPFYDFPRITANGSYSTPIMKLEGNRIRYVQTISGATPSFTRSVTRNVFSGVTQGIKQLVDRSISITTLNSTTPSLYFEGCNEVNIVLATGANSVTNPVVLTLEGSEDNSNWYDLGNISVTGVAANTAYFNKASDILSKYIRARVTTAAVGGNLNFVSIKGRG